MRRVSWLVVAMTVVVAACSGSADVETAATQPVAEPAGSVTATVTTTSVGGDVARVASTLPAPLDAADGTLPLAEEALDDPEVTTVATDLAPSQVVATTVPRPPTPPECTGDQVELWTAQVVPNGDGTVNALIRVRNSGGVWCEPDIGRSPLLDPNVEPDVWLEPGQTADLWVGQMPGECANPALVTLIQVGIGTDSIVVPSAVVTCGWWLNAFYPNDPVTEPCTADQLEFIALSATVVVRNSGGSACVFGAISSVEGAATAEGSPPEPLVDVLFPGDIARLGAPVIGSCDDADRTVTLNSDTFGSVTIENVPCDVTFELAGARAWVGARFNPDLTIGDLDADAVLRALDPFGDAS